MLIKDSSVENYGRAARKVVGVCLFICFGFGVFNLLSFEELYVII